MTITPNCITDCNGQDEADCGSDGEASSGPGNSLCREVS